MLFRSVLFGVLKNPALSPGEKLALALDFDSVLGLRFEEALSAKEEILPDEVQALVRARDEARRAKNWAESDRLRGELTSKGYLVEDSSKGTKVKKS